MSRLTDPGVMAGTPPYMAPEQLLGQPTSARTDQFAFGVLLYELITGRHPFGGDSLPNRDRARAVSRTGARSENPGSDLADHRPQHSEETRGSLRHDRLNSSAHLEQSAPLPAPGRTVGTSTLAAFGTPGTQLRWHPRRPLAPLAP